MKKISTNASARTTDATRILDHITGTEPAMLCMIEEARANAQVAQLIYDARKNAGLTQKELAKLVGTTQSVIARLEDAEYEGRSLTMLNRIAIALERRVQVRFVPQPRAENA